MAAQSQCRVLVTGAAGNLGRKLIAALLATPWCSGVIAVDAAFASGLLSDDPRVARVEADLRRRSATLRDAVAGADALVHLAAQNPYPEASWDDAVASFDMTMNLVALAADNAAARAKRLVFASSNHVMGGYKESDPALAPGSLTTSLPPRPGTLVTSHGVSAAPPAYAVAKLMGERVCAGMASASGLTTVSLRIGWCQPGRNHPGTISASGIPGAAGDPEAGRDLAWFRGMWLSNRDFVDAVTSAIRADAAAWPQPAIVVNAMSDNTGMPWDIATTRELIGYAPVDDVWRELEVASRAEEL